MIQRRLCLVLGQVFLLTIGAGACGGDEEPIATPSEPRNRAKAKPAANKVGQGGALKFSYGKIEEDMRREFSENEFVPDSSGEERRDPFRSWVLRPTLDDEDTAAVTKTDVCTERGVKWQAPGYSVRDLQLLGLVKTGRSFAQFSDRSDVDSWVVRRGDCLGQEKAVVEEIGVGYVSLSITPEAPPNAPVPATQRLNVSLYDDELSAADVVSGSEN